MEMEFIINDGGILVKQKSDVVGKLTLSKHSKNVFVIVQVFVNPNYRGQGIASVLVNKMVNHAIKNNLKLVPHCSFAVMEFEKHLEYKDVLFNK